MVRTNKLATILPLCHIVLRKIPVRVFQRLRADPIGRDLAPTLRLTR